MFYLFNNIRKKDILDSVIAANDNKNNIDVALSKLLSFALEEGISGNVWKSYIIYTLIFNDNPYTRSIERNKSINPNLDLAKKDLVRYYELYSLDLAWLNELADLNFSNRRTIISKEIELIINKIDNSYASFEAAIMDFYINKGLANMALYKAFRVDNGILSPIYNVLDVSFDDLIGYDYQKSMLIENTENFIAGKPYNNVLLYGDSGTGKSTSIKALLNTYFDNGLRIIEVYKHQMEEIAKIIHTLKNRPYSYVIYMDDLSFEEDEIEYKYLKSIIEGGIEPKPNNVVIYATSNRRHLIKETFKDNGDIDDDLHRNETQAEKLSLAYRFGLQIFYSSLSPKEFRKMVIELANKNNISIEENTLLLEANKWELTYGSLSGRCATQFINYLVNKITK